MSPARSRSRNASRVAASQIRRSEPASSTAFRHTGRRKPIGIDAVLVTELSRWGRSTTDLLATLKELQARRVSVIALNGMTFDLSTPPGRMIATVLAGIAEFERELIQERIRSGIAAAKARGKRPRPPARAAAEIRSSGAEGPGARQARAQLPPDRSRGWAEQEHHRRHRQTKPGSFCQPFRIMTFPLRTANRAVLPVLCRDPNPHCWPAGRRKGVEASPKMPAWKARGLLGALRAAWRGSDEEQVAPAGLA
jgi:hypothetical protein